MGLLDFLFGKKPPAPAAPDREPPPTPFPATIATVTPDGVGTLSLADGSTLRFGASACQGFQPAAGVQVRVGATGPHPLGGWRATAVMLVSDPATYQSLLAAQMASMPALPPAPPGPPMSPPVAAAPAAAAQARPPPPVDLRALDAPAPPGKRRVMVVRFENPRPPDLFFRELTLDGRAVRIFAGQAPADAPTAPKHVYDQYGTRYPTGDAAREAFERLVAEAAHNFKTRREEVREVDQPTATGACVSNPELEAGLERAVDPAAAAGVLADWLLSQNDPRGELAALLQRGKEAEAKAWLGAHAPVLLGDLDVALDNELYDLRWRHGFLEGASLRRRSFESETDLAALTKDFLALPLARFVTALRFGLASFESDNDWTETLRAVVESPRGPLLRSLRFDDYTYEDCELSWTPFGDFSAFWPKLPALEWLHIRSGEGGVLGDIELPNLKTFIRESGGLAAEELRSIVKARWPKLERLDVWFGNSGYGAAGTLEMIQPLLDGEGPPGLTHLGIVNCEFSPAAVQALSRSKLLPRLAVLDLSKGVLTDRDVEPFLAHPDAFRHLARIDLTENFISEQAERLKAALPSVVLGEQRELEDEEDQTYVAVGE